MNRNNPGDGSAGYFPSGIGWYRRTFTVPQSWSGKRVSVEFGGVYKNAEVWINGQHLGSHPYGYTTFYYDLTPNLRSAKRTCSPCAWTTHIGNTRWYSGSGIYRHVWLNVTEPVHVAQWGMYVTTPEVSESKAQVVGKPWCATRPTLRDSYLTTRIWIPMARQLRRAPPKVAARATGQSRKAIA